MTAAEGTQPSTSDEKTPEWSLRLDTLTRKLAGVGALRSSRWQRVFRSVPRHALVTNYFRQDSWGRWAWLDTDHDEGLRAVYSDTALCIRRDDLGIPSGWVAPPNRIARMLELLELEDPHRVLEIGTGHGYTTALLTARLGDEQVFSQDSEDVTTTEGALAGLGLRPYLRLAEDKWGMATRAPFDRIIASNPVPAVPGHWVDQVHEGGLIVARLEFSTGAGNLVALRRAGESAQGRFGTNPEGSEVDIKDQTLPLLRPGETVPWFLAGLELPRGTTYQVVCTSGGRIMRGLLAAPDGSAAVVSAAPGAGGRRLVEQTGRFRLWDVVERAFEWWEGAGRPGWERFGLTVSRGGANRLWLDQPSGEQVWVVPRCG